MLRNFCNFYPRPPRGGRQQALEDLDVGMPISTHALREEGDPRAPAHHAKAGLISTHALREEGDPGAA